MIYRLLQLGRALGIDSASSRRKSHNCLAVPYRLQSLLLPLFPLFEMFCTPSPVLVQRAGSGRDFCRVLMY
jgi:hypothetical protein